MNNIPRISVVLALFLFLISQSLYAINGRSSYRKNSRKEKKADHYFIRGEYNKSILLYESIVNTLENKNDLALLHLKIARLCVALMMHQKTVNHYDYVFEHQQLNLTIDDICNYADALRQCKEYAKAELICRSFAFNEHYSRNQRFSNLLNSLIHNRYYSFYPDEAILIENLPLAANSTKYWIGEYQDESFYAMSNSYVQDPSKVFYHQNQFMTLGDSTRKSNVLKILPLAMQNGPVAFSKNGDLMIATVNEYNGIAYIEKPDSENPVYRTNLFYSVLDRAGGRWSGFRPLINNEEKYSYAHPYLINNDSSLLFSSNRPGGYGEMDLYRIDRISNTEWSEPVNLGPLVNTDGNEIFPYVSDGKLIFSSNGFIGNGGYDMYQIVLSGKQPVKGTLYHFPSPINSAFNDFGYKHLAGKEYFVSDRYNRSDNIYQIKRIGSGLQLEQETQKLNFENTLKGSSAIINGYDQSIVKMAKNADGNSSLYKLYKENQLLLSVYFDFDSDQITEESQNLINDLMQSGDLRGVESLRVIGYADELGSSEYNLNLSESRAIKVMNEIAKFKTIPSILHEGRGKLLLKPTLLNNGMINMDLNPELSGVNNIHATDEMKRLLRPARKVDIIVHRVKQNK